MNKINWYPGHMKKATDTIREDLKVIDVVIEILDARVPLSSKNPVLDSLLRKHRRIIILNKYDLAGDSGNERWKAHFRAQGADAFLVNSITGFGIKELERHIMKIKSELDEKNSFNKPMRLMVVGIPNVGKSSFINRMTKKRSTVTGDKPGVTRGKQIIRFPNNVQLMDTPGILWPNFEDELVALRLAFCGCIKDEILDTSTLAVKLIDFLIRDETGAKGIEKRYKLPFVTDDAVAVMDDIARARGFLIRNGEIDYERTGRTILDEFRKGLLGRITLEYPEEFDD